MDSVHTHIKGVSYVHVVKYNSHLLSQQRLVAHPGGQFKLAYTGHIKVMKKHLMFVYMHRHSIICIHAGYVILQYYNNYRAIDTLTPHIYYTGLPREYWD